MAAIGWLATGLTEANAFFATRAGAVTLWAGLTDSPKTAALTTAYNKIRFSKQVEIPSSPTAAQMATLAYAQKEYALHFVVLGDGGIRREAVQGQGVKSAGVVKETYIEPNKKSGLPPEILEILDGFKKQKSFYSVEIYRDETVNEAHDTRFDTRFDT
jgi:hypothetical protein